MSESIDVLTNDHKTLLRVANVLDSMSGEAEDKAQFNSKDVQAMLKILRLFADDYVQAKEEGALFPAFSSVCDVSQFSAIRQMLFEHDRDRSLIDGMEDAFRVSNPYQFAEYASRFAALVRKHVSKEETLVFDTIGRSLSDADDARIVAEFADYDREFARLHEKELMHHLRVLEWKYLRNVA